ncbi:hypothetical protein ACIPF8_10650 [Collimonas sp. NPDC087041]|uniref:hypothetical protein n=1 Tax=Collimonas sp. NPDC087041 TaxID=3363960 RepID=UPI00382990BB
MDLKISNPEWVHVGSAPLNGPAQQIKGDILALTFKCSCGHEWRARATHGGTLGRGQFVRTYSGLTVNCPGQGCDLQWKVSKDEYENL